MLFISRPAPEILLIVRPKGGGRGHARRRFLLISPSLPAARRGTAVVRLSEQGPRGRTISAKPAADHPKARGGTAPLRRRSFLIPLHAAPQSTVRNPRGYRAAFCTLPPAKPQIDTAIVHRCDNIASDKAPAGSSARAARRTQCVVVYVHRPPRGTPDAHYPL